MRQATAQQQMNQQGLLANQANDTAQQQMAQSASQYAGNQAADATKFAAQQGQNAFSNDLATKNLAIDQQKVDQDGMAKHMAKLLDMDKKDLQSRGAQAAYGLMAMKGAKTPEEGQQIRTALLQDSVSKKIITQEQAAQAAKAPLSQFTAMLGQELIATGQAAEYAAMQKALSPPADKSGNNIEFYGADEGGGIKSITTDPNTAVKSAVQKDVIKREKDIQQLAVIRDNFKPENFTYKNKAGVAASAVAELSKGTPGLEQATEYAAGKITGQDADEREKLLKDTSSYFNSVEQFFNSYRSEITGAAAAEKELERLRLAMINRDLSPSQMKGALDQLMTKMVGQQEFDKLVLRKGVDATPSSDVFEQARKDPRYADRSDEQLRRDIAYTNRRQ